MAVDIFLWGCLGAAFPEILRQYNLRNQGVGVPPGYFIRSAIFVLASGFVVLALPGQLSPITAIYAGVAAPLIVTTGGRQFSKALSLGRRAGSQAEPDDADHSHGDPQSGEAESKDDDTPPDIVAADDISHGAEGEVYVRIQNEYVPQAGWARFWRSL